MWPYARINTKCVIVLHVMPKIHLSAIVPLSIETSVAPTPGVQEKEERLNYPVDIKVDSPAYVSVGATCGHHQHSSHPLFASTVAPPSFTLALPAGEAEEAPPCIETSVVSTVNMGETHEQLTCPVDSVIDGSQPYATLAPGAGQHEQSAYHAVDVKEWMIEQSCEHNATRMQWQFDQRQCSGSSKGFGPVSGVPSSLSWDVSSSDHLEAETRFCSEFEESPGDSSDSRGSYMIAPRLVSRGVSIATDDAAPCLDLDAEVALSSVISERIQSLDLGSLESLDEACAEWLQLVAGGAKDEQPV